MSDAHSVNESDVRAQTYLPGFVHNDHCSVLAGETTQGLGVQCLVTQVRRVPLVGRSGRWRRSPSFVPP